MATVHYDNVTCRYAGAERPAVTDLDLEIADGEFLVLVGPSGCGKSTTLRMLAGLEEVTAGRIFIGRSDVTEAASRDRDIAMVFQNYALYPNMSVADNMGFALKVARVPAAERRSRVEEAARMLDLSDYLDRKPKALSGGQRQRVAMGRAIVRSPQVFLMDEPLSNLDAKLRVSTRTQIASLTRRLGVTTVYVTHDQTEAMTMGDRVAVLKDGHLLQVDTPRALYDRPASVFVAGFIGSPAMNLFRARVDDDVVPLGALRLSLTRAQRAALSGDAVSVGIRPEDLALASEGTGLPIVTDVVEELGADAYLYGHLASDLAPSISAPNTSEPLDPIVGAQSVRGAEPGLAPQQIVIRLPGRTAVQRGSTIWITPDVAHLHLFDAATGDRLPD